MLWQVQLSDRNFWTTYENASADAADRVNDRRAIIEGVPVANALRDLNADDSAERADMWRRHWDQHMEESQRRLEELHAAQDNMGHIADHAVRGVVCGGGRGAMKWVGLCAVCCVL